MPTVFRLETILKQLAKLQLEFEKITVNQAATTGQVIQYIQLEILSDLRHINTFGYGRLAQNSRRSNVSNYLTRHRTEQYMDRISLLVTEVV